MRVACTKKNMMHGRHREIEIAPRQESKNQNPMLDSFPTSCTYLGPTLDTGRNMNVEQKIIIENISLCTPRLSTATKRYSIPLRREKLTEREAEIAWVLSLEETTSEGFTGCVEEAGV